MKVKRMMKVVLLIIAICILAGLLLVAAAVISMERAAKTQTVPADTPAIVLGCRVKGEVPSRILSERTNAAYDYLQTHEQAVAVLSGGMGEGELISEAECMKRLLLERGIDEKRLLIEDQSVNTQTNLSNSKKLLEETLGETPSQVVIITSEFHEYRAIFHAKQLGFQPVAYASKTGISYKIPFYLREIVAVIYTWFFRR